MNLIELEYKTQELLHLWSLRPVPKQAWMVFEALTKLVSVNPRMFHSYTEQWLSEFPEQLEAEDIAGLSPDIWLSLYNEWVEKKHNHWIDIPQSVISALTQAKDWSLEWVSGSITQTQTDKTATWVPTVESVELAGSKTQVFGRLRQLELVLQSVKPSGEGRLVMERAQGNQPDEDRAFRNVNKVVSQWVNQTEKKWVEADGLIRYKDRSGIHEGKSMGLAAYLTVGLQLAEQVESQHHYTQTNGNTAYTGELSDDGLVLPVDESGLHTKVIGCFFSWIQQLIVPIEQAKICREWVKELNEIWPDKKLEIIGIEKAEQVFTDRRITQLKTDPMVIHKAKWVWKRKNGWLGWASLFALVVVIWRVWYGPIDKNPSYVDGEGEYFVVKNKNGEVLRRFFANSMDVTLSSLNGQYPIFLYNLNPEDEVTEIVVPTDSLNNLSVYNSNKISVYQVEIEKPIWSFKAKHSVTYPRIMGSGDQQAFVGILSAKIIQNKSYLFSTISNGYSFNTILQQISYPTCDIVQQYVHPGGILSIQFYDFLKDGEDELVLTAINNALFSGSIIILDASKFDGNGITDGDYISTYSGSAKELAYIRIPKSGIPNLKKSPKVHLFSQSFRNNEFVVRVTDYYYEEPVKYELVFDYNLEVKTILTTDEFDVVVRDLEINGHLETPMNFDYWQDFMKTKIQHWDGKQWQPGGGWAKW